MTISVFNYSWFLFLALAVGYIIFTTKRYSDKTDAEKLQFIFKQSLFFCAFWILYKVGIGLDKEYTEFEFWNELPLFPCNTVIWLSLIACKKNSKTIMAYCFYCGVLFAMLAMLMPAVGFDNINFFTARCIGYYGTHWFVIIIGIQFATLKLFKINIKSCILAAVCFLAIAAIMHVINIIMRATIYPDASYYFTFGNEDNSVLTMIKSYIPYNYFYLVPLACVGSLIFMLETVIINSLGRLFHK